MGNIFGSNPVTPEDKGFRQNCGDGDLEEVRRSILNQTFEEDHLATSISEAILNFHSDIVELLMAIPDFNVNHGPGFYEGQRNGGGVVYSEKCFYPPPIITASMAGNIEAISILTLDSRLTGLNQKLASRDFSDSDVFYYTVERNFQFYEMSPVMISVTRGDLEAVKVLVEVPGLDLDTTNDRGWTLEQVARYMVVAWL